MSSVIFLSCERVRQIKNRRRVSQPKKSCARAWLVCVARANKKRRIDALRRVSSSVLCAFLVKGDPFLNSWFVSVRYIADNVNHVRAFYVMGVYSS